MPDCETRNVSNSQYCFGVGPYACWILAAIRLDFEAKL